MTQNEYQEQNYKRSGNAKKCSRRRRCITVDLVRYISPIIKT